ncbi:O-antigen ligase family protein [Empedobacter stercoris]|uniref:O-antigen ligase family protein n=1 Tax=Empedobacter stercoris TaxID=1628248 RepID=UPI0039ED3677
MISKEKFNLINNWLLILILSTIFFRAFSTILIFVFGIFNILHYKYLTFNKKIIPFFLVLAVPFLLEIVFLWNNLDSPKIFKPLEKVLSFLIFPLFITLNYKGYKYYYIADWYRKVSTFLIVILMIRFCIISPEYVNKYINGIHLWEMGYVFANSFGNHAPAVNMNIAFVVVLNLFFMLKNYPKTKVYNLVLLMASIISLFIINTRLSLGSCILCCLIVVIWFAYRKYKIRSIYFIGVFTIVTSLILVIAFISNPYMKEKYSKVTFANMDKIGKLDEVENPDGVLHNALVTRVSIWKSTIELGNNSFFTGVGSANAKQALFNYFELTNQKFLSKYEFPVHNQFLDYFLRFGIIGFISLIFYFGYMLKLSLASKNIIGISFVLNFFLSNLFDDFLIRFDGILFSAIWFSLIVVFYLDRIQDEVK